MQNRTMFPYRRPGQKKRPKNIPNHRNRTKGAPPKGMPGTARELLPMLQPATKALAHVLAGRTQRSGQHGHARSVLARAERAVAERATDRLNPAEREEFFEQLARLKLTVADAEAEAEAGAGEEAGPSKPAPPPVDPQRLREMALALATPATAAPAAATAPPPEPEAAAPASEPTRRPSPPGRLLMPGASAPTTEAAPAAARPVAVRPAATAPASPGRRVARRNGPRPMPVPEAQWPAPEPEHPTPGPEPQRPTPEPERATKRTVLRDLRRPAAEQPAPAAEAGNGKGADAGAKAPERRRTGRGKSSLHLPEGWVIDEEGFVVPRSG